MKLVRLRSILVASVASGGIVMAAPSYAQDAAAGAATAQDSAGIADIIVTANKRNERLQDVPIAITAVTSEALASSGVRSTAEIAQLVPGLTLQVSGIGVQPHLRGVGTTAVPAGTENSVATYVDGVYMLSMAGALLQLNSIDQIEVLKGPQGTLFGRNATGGVVNVRTRDPKHELGGEAAIQYGNYETFSGQAYITGGISPTLAVDLSAFVSLQGKGWGRNIGTGKEVYKQDDYVVRSKWLFTPGDRDEFRLAGDWFQSKGSTGIAFRMMDGSTSQYGPGSTVAGARPDMAPYVASGAVAPFAVVGDPYLFNGRPYDISMAIDPLNNFRGGGVSLQWDHEFDGFRIQTISAYRKSKRLQRWSATPVPVDRTNAELTQKEEQFSQEFQIASLPSSPVQWVAGLYYLNGSSDYDPFFIQGSAVAPLERLLFHAYTGTKSGAAFGQATIPLGEKTNITVGGRYNIERRTITGDTVLRFLPAFGGAELTVDPTDARKTFKKFTWRLSLDHKFTNDILGYASFNRGFKSGIYNTIPPGGPTAAPVEPEVLDAYEVGLKTELFDRVVRFNISAFMYKYQQLQVTVFTPVSALIQNGAKAEIYGVDADFVIQPDKNLSITGGFAAMKSKFQSYPNAQYLVPLPVSAGGGNDPVPGSAAGNELPYAPDFTGNIGINYTVPLASGEVNASANYSYSGSFFAGPDNILKQPSYGLLNSQISWKTSDTGPTIGIFAKNITKEKYYTYLSAGNNPGGYNQGIRGAPRTYGVSLGYKF